MSWQWFKSAVDVVNPDKFRIKVITLKDGTKKYYPQYKGEISSSYLCLVHIGNKDTIITHDVNDFDLINSNKYYWLDEESARQCINDFKDQLFVERSKEFQSEEIIKL